jgi:hypothetical protein
MPHSPSRHRRLTRCEHTAAVLLLLSAAIAFPVPLSRAEEPATTTSPQPSAAWESPPARRWTAHAGTSRTAARNRLEAGGRRKKADDHDAAPRFGAVRGRRGSGACRQHTAAEAGRRSDAFHTDTKARQAAIKAG